MSITRVHISPGDDLETGEPIADFQRPSVETFEGTIRHLPWDETSDAIRVWHLVQGDTATPCENLFFGLEGADVEITIRVLEKKR